MALSKSVWIIGVAAVLGGAVARGQAPAPAPPPPSPQPASQGSPSAPPAAPVSEVDTRHALARQFVKDQKFDQAVDEYAWLWENTLKVDPTKAALRESFIASGMERLASQHAPAKARFATLRDDAERRLKDAPALAPRLVDDFLLLNRIVGEPARTVAWFDAVKTDAARGAEIPGLSQRLEQVLEADGRWVDLSTYVYRKPREIAQAAMEANRAAVLAANQAPAGQRDMLTQTQERSYNARVTRLYAALLVAKRDAEASQVLDIIASGDTFGRTVLACISRGLELNEAREAMRKPLDDAWKKGAGIKGAREKLNHALKRK